MEKLEKPQIICHIEKSVNYSLFDTKWVPCSTKFVVMGSKARGTGILQIYEISNGELKLVKDIEKSTPVKCGTFKASNLRDRYLATGDFMGKLNVYDLEDPSLPIYTANAHTEIVNAIDGMGGQTIGCGAPELVTGSRDGSVKVWDLRQKSKPVAIMETKNDKIHRDCWTVTFGNSFNSVERAVLAGYDNGDIKMFDLKSMTVRWESNLKNGICSLEFDRKDIPMNKLVATTLESKLYLFDLKTQHPKKGFAYLSEKAHNSTIWLVKHLPQNREIFVTCGGGGSLCLWKYNYPEKRKEKDADGLEYGITGSLTPLQNSILSSQPINSLDWSTDKQGLAVCTSFDQCIRIIITTKLHTY
ncbi:dynein axonemal assembly factor 10 [Prorops nasuta]|uniref:dynein axonemal assembly factor 10 n=1 Tax=Prorops nasuta TaxID=863751 RepID=UPI0034CF045D